MGVSLVLQVFAQKPKQRSNVDWMMAPEEADSNKYQPDGSARSLIRPLGTTTVRTDQAHVVIFHWIIKSFALLLALDEKSEKFHPLWAMTV